MKTIIASLALFATLFTCCTSDKLSSSTADDAALFIPINQDNIAVKQIEPDPSKVTIKATQAPITEHSKEIWAGHSSLYLEAPEVKVEKWITEVPELKNKFVLINFFATWCPPSRFSLAVLDDLQVKFKNDLVVICITDEVPEALFSFLKSRGVHYHTYFASDPAAQMKSALDVQGFPHAILIEPEERTIIWEGFPLLKGYELTEKQIQKAIDIRNQSK